jgi:cyclase
MYRMLRAGADKISINTAAVLTPNLIEDGAKRFGSQCIVLSIDARRVQSSELKVKSSNDESQLLTLNSKLLTSKWEVFTHTGANARVTGLDAVEWARRGVELGAGEILLTSMDADGTLAGYDLELTRAIAEAVNVPIIASGGAGRLEHFATVLTTADADAALAASLFHDKQLTVGEVKRYLIDLGLPIRPII